MKKTWTLLLFPTLVSVSFGRHVPVKNGTSLVTAPPQADEVNAVKPRAAGGAKHESYGQFVFHAVMVGFIVVTAVFFICVTLTRPCCASKTRGTTVIWSVSFRVKPGNTRDESRGQLLQQGAQGLKHAPVLLHSHDLSWLQVRELPTEPK